MYKKHYQKWTYDIYGDDSGGVAKFTSLTQYGTGFAVAEK